jgi:predicted phosphatase
MWINNALSSVSVINLDKFNYFGIILCHMYPLKIRMLSKISKLIITCFLCIHGYFSPLVIFHL